MKAEVMLLDPHRATMAQPGLFDLLDPPRPQALMHTIDAINRTHGRNALHFAAAGRRQVKWKLRSDHLLPRFTTRWELPRV